MARQTTTSPRPIRRRSGFTLIELMIVAAIIVVLAGITVAVGIGAKDRAGIRATRATLKALDGIMKEYIAAGNPEPKATASPNNQTEWVQMLRASPETASKLSNLTTKSTNNSLTFIDSFGKPIVYVPSTFDNGTVATPGYFKSGGPDGILGTGANDPHGADDLFSTDP